MSTLHTNVSRMFVKGHFSKYGQRCIERTGKCSIAKSKHWAGLALLCYKARCEQTPGDLRCPCHLSGLQFTDLTGDSDIGGLNWSQQFQCSFKNNLANCIMSYKWAHILELIHYTCPGIQPKKKSKIRKIYVWGNISFHSICRITLPIKLQILNVAIGGWLRFF